MRATTKSKSRFYLWPTGVVTSLLVANLFAQALPSGDFWKEDDVIFELVAQGRVPSPDSAIQFGYLSSIEGLESIFVSEDPNSQNESTALFTFFNDSTTLRTIVNGGLAVIDREGTMTVYFDASPDGDFGDPPSFSDGIPVQTSVWRHQVILDLATGRLTVVFTNRVTSVQAFDFGGQRVRLGKPGDRFRMNVSGLVSGPGVFELAGYGVLAARE